MSILPDHPGDENLKDLLASFIRVDHAGEFGAIRIYKGQLDYLKSSSQKPESSGPRLIIALVISSKIAKRAPRSLNSYPVSK